MCGIFHFLGPSEASFYELTFGKTREGDISDTQNVKPRWPLTGGCHFFSLPFTLTNTLTTPYLLKRALLILTLLPIIITMRLQ